MFIWISLILLYAQSTLQIGDPILPTSLPLQILIRSVIIVFAWYFLFGPLVKWLIQYWLKKKQSANENEVSAIASLLPLTKNVVYQCWHFAAVKKGWSRIVLFLKMILAKSLAKEPELRKIFIFSGEIHSGKTTSLLKWIDHKADVTGVLTPVIDGKRFFVDIQTGEKFEMEAAIDEEKFITIGKHRFSERNFDKAKLIVRNAMQNTGWLVIDEIGPLEIRGEGFSAILNDLLQNQNNKQNILLVVRKGIVADVISKFHIPVAVVINSVDELMQEGNQKSKLVPV
jgi:nucleoside-triphosphatase THEP1